MLPHRLRERAVLVQLSDILEGGKYGHSENPSEEYRGVFEEVFSHRRRQYRYQERVLLRYLENLHFLFSLAGRGADFFRVRVV